MTQKKKKVFSGLRPTGGMHLGNYLGAIRQFLELQEEYDAIYGIVDYHALTSLHNGEELKRLTHDFVLDYLALGLDPDKCTLIKQSDIPAHTELAWLLSTVTPVSWAERTPSYKEKMELQPDDVNLGLLNYPILMAADILIYKAEFVPVGKDQLAHLELTREITRSFNRRYGEIFPEPQSLVMEHTAMILGTDGQKKMSKTAGNTIEIFLEPPQLEKKVTGMVTDPQRRYRNDPGRPEVCNVFNLHKIFTPDEVPRIEKECRAAEIGCVDCKKLLAERINSFAEPFRETRKELEQKPGIALEVLSQGASRARVVASHTMAEVRDRMGLNIADGKR